MLHARIEREVARHRRVVRAVAGTIHWSASSCWSVHPLSKPMPPPVLLVVTWIAVASVSDESRFIAFTVNEVLVPTLIEVPSPDISIVGLGGSCSCGGLRVDPGGGSCSCCCGWILGPVPASGRIAAGQIAAVDQMIPSTVVG